MVGRFSGRDIALREVRRFENQPLHHGGALRWNVDQLFADALASLRGAGPVDSVGVDTWACDYGLLDRGGSLLGMPVHYRDRRTADVQDRVFAAIPREELYARTGIQHLQFNTVFQLVAEDPALLERTDRIAMMPDLLAYWLTGTLANEATVASSTGLADVHTRSWARDLIDRLGLPATPFAGSLVEAGTLLGPADARHELPGNPMAYAVAAHDTASAFVAAPVASPGAAIISCGTWSLVGVELGAPVLGEDARQANLSNEWGIDGTTRLLRNVMGLWLLQECRRTWAREGVRMTDVDLARLAGSASDDVAVFDPDIDVFFAPGDMPVRVAQICRATSQTPPETVDEFTRSILLSLACKYRFVLERIAEVRGTDLPDIVHVVGGGSRNALLCQLTADVIGRPVLAGPAEATAVGNILVQLRAMGAMGSLAEMRDCVRRSFIPRVHEPRPRAGVYERFLAASELGEPIHA